MATQTSRSAPGEAVSGEAVSGEAVSGEAVSGEPVSGEAVSGEPVSGEPAPRWAVLGEALLDRWDGELADFDTRYAATYPGPAGPGPVHTVYVPVPAFDVGVIDRWSGQALSAIRQHPAEWQAVIAGLPGKQHERAGLTVRTLAKLGREPIEDLRIDFEDGFRAHRGTPADDQDEDAHAVRAADVAAAMPDLPRSWGLRIRSLAPGTRRRGLRTLEGFMTELLARTGSIPDGFVITLPKVTGLQQIDVFLEVLTAIETGHGLPAGSLRFEIQVETPQTVLGADGTVPVAQMIHAAAGRVSGLHFGTYDYTASLGVLGAQQDLRHPVADFAKGLMMLAAAETGVRVSDGSDNKVPLGPPEVVQLRWAAHAEGVLRALRSGIYQDGTCIPPSCRPDSPPRSRSSATGGSTPPGGSVTITARPPVGCLTSRQPPTRWPVSWSPPGPAGRWTRPNSTESAVSATMSSPAT